jgi:exonuclease SbcC
MSIEVINKNKSWKYNKIFHLSDIHIRNTEEHVKIYIHVFENLYEYLRGSKSDNSLIVITGDILHNKDRLTTTCETLCIDFFEKLSSLMTTIIIPGNHDFNEKNNTKEDSLSTILYKRDFNNLYYLKLSGVYRFNNILFGVSSLIDNKMIKAVDITDSGIKIALYHGAVANSKNSKGFEFSKKAINNFDNYDLVLLGDIHYHQYLNDNKTIAYASSLISQNFSETDHNHGVLVWDLETKKSFYQPIHNEYRYEEIDIINNNIIYQSIQVNIDNLVLPIFGKLKINSSNCNLELYNKFVFNIKNKYPNLNIVHNKLLIDYPVSQTKTNEIQTITVQSIIESEIQKLPEETKNYVQQILLKEIKSAVQSVDEKLNWKLLKLEFSNMFSYGPNNIVDFTKLTFDEITGLFGPNSVGKSSLIDILLFSLFDDYSRNYQDKHKTLNGTIINTKEKTFMCKVSFLVDNTVYYIKKEGKRLGAKSENTFDTFKFIIYDFYKIESNEIVQLNGQTRFETLNKITKLIGNYDDFCVSSVCLQNNMRSKVDFYSMSSIEKKAFLNELLKFDIFKSIETKYKDMLKETKATLKNIEKMDDYINYNHNIIDKINELSITIANYDTQKNSLELQLSNYNNELNSLYKQLKYTDESLDYDLLDKQQINNDILLFQTKLDNIFTTDIENKIDELHNENLNLSSTLSSHYNSHDINELINDKKYILEQISIIKCNINKLHLIQTKDNIITNNILFEKQKLDKIIQLKSKIISEFDTNPNNKISNNIINNLNKISDSIIINNIQPLINETKINIINIEQNISNIINTIKYHENILSSYQNVCVSNKIKKFYYTINYNEYCNNMSHVLNDYYKYYELHKIIQLNHDVFNIFNDFNSSVNSSCSNCLKHSNNINKLFNKLQIQENIHIINNKFNKLCKIKSKYEQTVVYHNTIQINNCNIALNLFRSILQSEQLKLNSLINQSNDTTLYDFKNNIINNVNYFQQYNYNIDLNYTNSLVNHEYIELNKQITLYNSLNSSLNDFQNKLINTQQCIDNYQKDKYIFDKIESNKIKINELKIINNNIIYYNKQLHKLNQTIQSINNFQHNINIHTLIKQCKNNIELITQDIINANNCYNLNNTMYLKLLNDKNKYSLIIQEINKLNKQIAIFDNIIKLTGPKGIPRQIINIKLLHIENSVNSIILPFINKKINITKDIEDIKILIYDGINKYYSSGGMETFIISMAFKIAFTNTFNIPHSGILFIDEGVSVLDKNHVSNFSIISNFIKQYYNYVILITHIEAFYDYTFDVINIIKNKSKQSHVYYINDGSSPYDIITCTSYKNNYNL